MSGVTPMPSAAFSTLTMQKSIRRRSTSRSRCSSSTRRPALPTRSPTNRMRMRLIGSHRKPDRARLADHADPHLARVVHFLLDARGDVLGKPDSLLVAHLVGRDDDADLLARAHRAGLADPGERQSDLLESLHLLQKVLQHVLLSSG